MTEAKYQYMRDLLHAVCEKHCHGDKCDCPFPAMMLPLSAECCGWLADMDADRAVTALEIILGREYRADYDTPEVVRAIAERNGARTVLDLLQEECAELIQAVSKQRRYRSAQSSDSIIEEMADVGIMLDQLAALIPNGEALVKRERDRKLERTVKRYGIPVKEGRA